MIERHEQRIDDDAQRDKQFGERIEDQPRNALLELEPRPATVPHAKYIQSPAERLEGFVAKGRTVFVVFFCWKIVYRN